MTHFIETGSKFYKKKNNKIVSYTLLISGDKLQLKDDESGIITGITYPHLMFHYSVARIQLVRDLIKELEEDQNEVNNRTS